MTSTLESLQSRLQQGLTSCEAVVEQALAGAAGPAAAHVFTRLYPEAALAAARHADAQRAAGVPQGPLAGLPVSIKDLYDVAGETTLAGSVVCRGEPAAQADAPVVARLRRSGAALIGKTNMTEFAFSGVGINPHHGTPRNPADAAVARIPGGSSSGAAVSVALGLAVAGLGSDTGGSIRIPAALCGLVGFKSSQGRVPRSGALELSRSLDTVCAMTRSVSDCLTVDAVLSGAPLAVARRPLAGLRLALPQTVLLDGLDDTVARAYQRTLSRLSAAGAQLIEIPLAELAEIPRLNAPGGFSPVEAFAVHHERLARARDQFDPRVAARMALGASVLAREYLDMLDHRADWIARVTQALDGFDAVLCPTVPIVAPEIEPLRASDEAFFKANGLLLRNTFAFNYLDGCAFSLPCHAEGELPVGLMLASVRNDDARLATVALAVEQALAQA
ncbi:amidase [Curvibacter sp. HBC61]|uniref:Amidase n=1 Tax=Curvibacter cyanobacteriorum TaxID=3026422 RepID=A0ABT5N0M6_9BURK|nr:amidase [Curvibacter sp. HBC61]MDD0838568.1 amidase [Curvibacter sp. HBC61]